jgi:uncharacterized protein (TIGR02145 family)
VSSGATWCTLTNANATGNGTVTVNVPTNTAIISRAATVTVTSGTLTKTVAVAQAAAAPMLNVDKTTFNATVNAAAYTIDVTSNGTWTAAVNSGATWCTLTNTNATGNGTVTVNVAENTTVATRTATVTVTSGTLTQTVAVTQQAANPTLEVNRTTIYFGTNTASYYTLTVRSNTAWTATVNAGATWCTASPATGTDYGMVTVTVTECFYNVTRSATVTLTAGTLTRAVGVTQAARNPPPYAVSTQTWGIGDLTWSDRIVARSPWPGSHCATTEYLDYEGRFYYNWNCVNAAAAMLCPSPWRVPTDDDFRTLFPTVSGTIITPGWGYGGYYYGGEFHDVATHGYLWSSTVSPDAPDVNSWGFSYTIDPRFHVTTYLHSRWFQGNQFQVRCVMNM